MSNETRRTIWLFMLPIFISLVSVLYTSSSNYKISLRQQSIQMQMENLYGLAGLEIGAKNNEIRKLKAQLGIVVEDTPETYKMISK